MSEALTRGVRLYGTDEPVIPPRLLRAGPLTAELEAGNLRYIRFGGVEMIRAVSFIVRDKNWGTYNPAISELRDRRKRGRLPRRLRRCGQGRGAGIRLQRRDRRARRRIAALLGARARAAPIS